MQLAQLLVVIGAINWGLIGLFQFDLVATIFGGQTTVMSRIIYALVGVAGIVVAARVFMPERRAERR